MSNKRHQIVWVIFVLICGLLLTRGATWAGPVTPANPVLDPGMNPYQVSLTLAPEESAARVLSVTTGDNPIDKGDVMFVFDLTGSMGGELAAAKTSATEIMNEVVENMPNTWFGVASFMDYPGFFSYPGYSDTYGSAANGDLPWILNRNPTTVIPDVSSTINDLVLGYGNDAPESYSRMLYELDNSVVWRPNSKKIAVVFGDAPTHDLNFNGSNMGGDPGPDNIAQTGDDLDFETVVGNLRDKSISILAVNSGGVDGEPTFRGMSEGYATAAGTRGAYYLLGQTEDLPEKTVELILTETAIIDQIKLEVTEGYEDWITIPPSEPNVGPNSTVEFNVKFMVPTGTEPGFYPFVVRAVGDGVILGFAYIQIIVPGTDATTDNGFLPSDDGFKFSNNGSVPGPTWEMFRQFFGAPAVEYPNGDKIHAAAKFFNDEYSKSGGAAGACDGFTSSSLLNYSDIIQPNAGEFAMPVYSSLYDWKRNSDMEKAIAFNQAVQKGLELSYHHAVLANSVKNSPKAMFEYLKQGIANGEPMIGFINWVTKQCNSFPFNNCQKPGAHSLLPYRIDEVDEDTAHVYVYDPNQPGDDDVRIEFDLTDNTWSFDWPVPLAPDIEITGDDDDSYVSISFAPLEIYTHKGMAPWLSIFPMNRDGFPQPTFRLFNTSGVVNILFIDDEGRKLGFDGDIFLAEIPDAHYIPDAFGAAEIPSGTFLIPENAVVDISLSAPESGNGFLRSYGEGFMLDLSLTEIVAGSTAKLQIDADGQFLSLEPQVGNFTADLTVNQLLVAEDRTISIIGAKLDAGETMRVDLAVSELPATDDVVGISGLLLSEKTLGLSIHRAGGVGYSVFGSAELTMKNAFDAHVALPDWSNLSSVSLEIDRNQDGIIDEVVELENEATPESVLIEASQTAVTGLGTDIELAIAVKDQFDAYVANGTPVQLQSDSGSLVPTQDVTSGGFMYATFTPDKIGVATITVTSGTATATIEIEADLHRIELPVVIR